MKIEERIEMYAADVLAYLADLLPDVKDDGILGSMVLEKALETYKIVLDNPST